VNTFRVFLNLVLHYVDQLCALSNINCQANTPVYPPPPLSPSPAAQAAPAAPALAPAAIPGGGSGCSGSPAMSANSLDLSTSTPCRRLTMYCHDPATSSGTAPSRQGLTLVYFQLNVSTLCGIRWVVSVKKTAQVEPTSGRVEGLQLPGPSSE
jgi:hypothetical protein